MDGYLGMVINNGVNEYQLSTLSSERSEWIRSCLFDNNHSKCRNDFK